MKMDKDFAHFGLESGMVFEDLWTCENLFIVSIPNEEERKRDMLNTKCILRNLYCRCSSLSNDDLISYRPGL